MLTSAYVSHSSQGRLRIRIPEKRKDFEYFSQTQKALNQIFPGLPVEVNAFTGSVLIVHDRENAQAIISRAKEEGLFDCVSPAPSVRKVPALTDIMKEPWVVKGMMGLGFLQILRGRPLAPSSSLLMDAYRLWMTHHSH